jgi:PAS domain S-box-containing protein
LGSVSLSGPERALIRVRVSDLMAAAAGIVAAWAVMRERTVSAGRARSLLAGALGLWAVELVVLGLVRSDGAWLVGLPFLSAGTLFLVVVAVVAWFLEQEAARARQATQVLEETDQRMRRRLQGEELLQDVSTRLVGVDATSAAAASQAALARMAGFVGARSAFLVEVDAGGPSVWAAWRGDDDLTPAEAEDIVGDLAYRVPRPLQEGNPLERAADGDTRDLLVPCRIAGGLAGVLGFRGVSPEGSDAAVEESWYGLAGGLLAGLLARVRVERDSAAVRVRLQAAFRAFPDAVSITRASDGVLLEVNRGFEEVTGWTRGEVVGRSTAALAIWAIPEQREAMVAELAREGRVRDRPCDFRMRDGRTRRFLVSAEAIQVEGEACLLAVSRDRTEVLQLEEELRRAQRLEAIGRLAGGVAHDFNNLLTVVGGYAEGIVQDPTLPGETREAAEEIVRAHRRGRDLTRRLLSFARRQTLTPERVEVDAVIRDVSTMMDRLLPPRVRMELALGAAGAFTRVEKAQLEQALVNLAVNARDAMPDGGRVRIATRRTRLDRTELVAGTPVPAGRWIVLTVQDEGTGISESHMASIFDPFFTTKDVGRGSGLGLSTVYGVVQQAGGHIAVESEGGVGTTFRLFLPEAARDAPGAEAGEPEAEVAAQDRGGEGSGQTILLVEDESALRALFRRVLENAGFRVATAGDAGEALAWMDEHAGPVDLLLTDVVLPGRDGRSVARAFREAHPQGAVLFMTGYYDEGRGGLGSSDADVLRKPFTSAELTAKVRNSLQK